MATSLRQLQTQKQKLAPRQVLQARLLQLNTVNLEQAILSELEQNPLLEQVEPEESQEEEVKEETAVDDMDVSWKICTAMSLPIIFLKKKRTCRYRIGTH